MERNDGARIVEAADAEAASALADWLMARGLAFEFAGEHSGRRGYFFQVAAKLGRVGPRLRLRLYEFPSNDELQAAIVTHPARAPGRAR